MSAQSQPHVEPAGAALTGGMLWTAGILLAAANFLAVLDMTIANVSVPNIAGNLGASTSQGTWVITSYSVAEAITVPLTGWYASRFGTVRVFVTSMIGFGVFSALCGLAPNLESLVAFRVFQGLCGGPLLPLSQTLLLRIFPKEKQPVALALWAMTTLIAPVLGPILGGELCDNLGWPAIFYVNVPIALICGPIVWRMLKSQETQTVKTRIDVGGLVLLVVAVGALQIMLDLGKDNDWFESSIITGLAVTAVIGFAAFLIWELTEAEPIVNIRVFRHRGFATTMVTMCAGFGAYFGSNVLTPLWLQSNMGYTATWAGYATGVMGVTALCAAPAAALLSAKTDPRRLIFLGILWLGFTIFLRGGATSQAAFWQVALVIFLSGAGLPFFFLPVTSMALASVDPEETASAAGLMSFCRTLSGAFATSIMTTAWENTATTNQAELAGSMANTRGTVDTLMRTGMSHDQAVQTVTNMVQGQSVMLATNQLFLVCAACFVFGAMAIWLAPKPDHAVSPAMGH